MKAVFIKNQIIKLFNFWKLLYYENWSFKYPILNMVLFQVFMPMKSKSRKLGGFLYKWYLGNC